MGKYSIIGPGYKGRSDNVNASRCVNFYPELTTEDSKSIVGSLVGTPGLLLYVDTTLGPIRGAHFFNNRIYFVSVNKLYSVDSAKNILPIIDSATGNQIELATSEGRVAMADNGMYSTNGGAANQLAFVDGQNIYVVNVTTLVFSSFSIPAKTITFIGGYFLVDKGGAQFQRSDLYDGTVWPALGFSTADAYPDDLMATVNNHNEAWMIGAYSAEIYVADGSSNPMPFSRMGIIDYGTAAPHSVAKGNNTLFWLVSQRNGNAGEVFGIGMANGYGIEIVSPQSINYHLSRYTEVSDAWGYCYTDKGHEFYVLTFPSENATWVYDATTGMCHERSRYTGDPYAVNRHIGNAYVYAWGKHFVGSYLDGKIYEMSEEYLTDNGDPIASVRVAPPMDADVNLFINKLQIDAETGVGGVAFTDCVKLKNMTVASTPWDLAEEFEYIWVTHYGSDTVSKIDPATDTVVATITVGGGPKGIVAGGGYVWVSNSDDNTVSKIDPQTDAIVATIAVGTSPEGITYGGGYVWVPNYSSNNVSKIDPATDTVVATITVGTLPTDALYAGGFVWVANYVTSNVSKIDPTTDTVVATIATSAEPQRLASDSEFVYTTNINNSISKIKISDNSVASSVIAVTNPYGIVENDGFLWVASLTDLKIFKINPTTFVVDEAYPAGSSPIGVMYHNNAILFVDYGDALLRKVILREIIEPEAILSWSIDGGHTWSNDHPTSMGKNGQYTKRMIWRRLGAARNRCFRLAISSAVKKVLIGTYMDVEGGMY